MAKRNCILCEKEVGVWTTCLISLCDTDQALCEDCMQKFRQANDETKILLREKMARSPHLLKGDEVRANLPAHRRRWQQELEEKRQKQHQEQQRKVRLEAMARCCDQPMTYMGVSTFQLGEYSFLLGDWSHLMSGAMHMAIFRCETCGQLKFFDPEYVK